MAGSYEDCLEASSIDSVAAILKNLYHEEIHSETMLAETAATEAQSSDFKRLRSMC